MNPGDSAAAEITLAGLRALLLPSRAVLLPDLNLALVADLHLGKAESLRALGAPIAHAAMGRMLDEQFTRLAAVVDSLAQTQSHASTLISTPISTPVPPRLLILGDLLHAPIGLTPTVIDDVAERFAALRSPRGLHILLIRGNHDSKIDRVITPWGLHDLGHEWMQHHAGTTIRFVHEPPSTDDPPADITFAGHIHPAIRLHAGRGNTQSLKLPCYWIRATPQTCILPAFTNFAAGASITPSPTDTIHILIEDKVIKI